ncbi:hypothetical protein OESDEN_02584 [Oesophagostomum dentatum]|uniref:Alpha/beta hydrolase fold-3 domain-containing protein n=1 Tax=Oesophagostomum dentatum TaxID=61180 RepID=A0A0B1TMV6_OESDE|nr:hypothetical protein OESDEN_02584 [Oesophagostomum dentatum]
MLKIEGTYKGKWTNRANSKYPQASKITLAGHSAGAQLAFKVTAQLKNPRIKNLVLFAGVFDLKELPFCEIGTAIGMTPEEATKNSCKAEELAKLDVRVQILFAIKDAPRLVEQNRAIIEEAKKLGINVDAHEFVECDHFNLIHGLRHEHESQTKKFISFLGSDDA